MAQPSLIDLFGQDASYNPVTNKLEISELAIESTGILQAATASPIELLAAILINANKWLATNVDTAVNATSEVRVNSPSLRGDIEKVEYVYSVFLYSTTVPTINPNEL